MNDRTASQTNDLRAPSLEATLQNVWRRKQLVYFVQGLACFLILAGGLGLAILAVDWLLNLPGPVRLLLLIITLAASLRYAWKQGWRRLSAYRPQRISLSIESTYPELQSSLVSYVDFSRSGGKAGTSPRLLEHVCKQAVEQTRSLDFRAVTPISTIRRVLITAAIAIIIFVILNFWQPRMMSVFAQRLVNPMSDVSYPTDTIIVMETGDVNVPEGGQIALTARAEGIVPQRGSLHIRSEGRQWEQLDITASEKEEFSYNFREIYRSFEYRFSLGDAISKTYRVNVIKAPRIEWARIIVTPPDYTKVPQKERESLTLRVPEGSQLEWTLKLDKPVSTANLIPDDAEAIEMTTSSDGRILYAQTPARASGAYRFHWQEKEHGFEYEGAKHFLGVEPDHEPHVRIDYPPAHERGTLAKTLNVTFAARDDYGVTEAVLVYRRNESDPVRTPIGTFKPGPRIEQTIHKPVKELVDGLKEGDTITYQIEVGDDYPGKGGSQRATSETRRIQILGKEEYMAYLSRRRKSLLGSLRPVYRQERVATDNLRQIINSNPSASSDQTEDENDDS